VQLACLSGATGSALASVAPRSLVGSSLFMQATVPAYGSGTKSSDLGAADTQVLASLANGVFFDISQGSGALAGVYAIRGILVQAGVTTHSTQIAYNATSHSCLRVREQSGELFWDTSPDGNAWTPLWSSTYTMSQATLGALYAVAETNYSGTEVASVLVVENANTVPGPSGGVVPGPYQTLVWSDEFTGTSLDTTKWTTPLPPPPPSTGPNISSADLTAMGITVGARLDPGDATMLTPSHWGLVAGSLPHNQANGSATTNNPALAKFGQSHYGGPTDSYLHCSIASGQGIWGVADKMPAPNAKWIVEFSVKMGGPNATHAYGWGSGWVLGVLGSGNSQEVDTIEFAGWSGSGDPGEPSCTTRNNVGTPVNFPGTSQPGYYNPSFVCSDGNFHTYTLCWDPVTGKQTLVWDGVQQYSIAIPSPSVAMQLNITTGYSGNSLLPPGGITGTNLIQADMVFKYIRYWAAT
jgi:hypothetical protein